MSGNEEQRATNSAPLHRSARGGHGCADPDYLPRRRVRLDLNLNAIAEFNAANERARDAYATRDAELDRSQRLYVGRAMAQQKRTT